MSFIINLLSFLSFFLYVNLVFSDCSVKKMYEFGDSLSDTGNLFLLNPNIPAAHLAYGETYPGYPSGRWSNGRLIIDFTADFLKIPYLQPYLNTTATFVSGVNFAVAGATAINTSVLQNQYGITPQPVPSLFNQIDWFKKYLSNTYGTNQAAILNDLSKSLVFFGEIGGNDLNYGLSSGKTLQDLYNLVPVIIQTVVDGIKQLIALGATRFVVPGNFPIGCITAFKELLANQQTVDYDLLGCNIEGNSLATYENAVLQNALIELRQNYPDVTFIYLDYYNAFYYVIANAILQGTPVANLFVPCCGIVNINVGGPYFCGSPSAPVCSNPSASIIWDGIHLTQWAYQTIFQFLQPYIALAVN